MSESGQRLGQSYCCASIEFDQIVRGYFVAPGFPLTVVGTAIWKDQTEVDSLVVQNGVDGNAVVTLITEESIELLQEEGTIIAQTAVEPAAQIGEHIDHMRAHHGCRHLIGQISVSLCLSVSLSLSLCLSVSLSVCLSVC